jgi:hypothetical protein
VEHAQAVLMGDTTRVCRQVRLLLHQHDIGDGSVQPCRDSHPRRARFVDTVDLNLLDTGSMRSLWSPATLLRATLVDLLSGMHRRSGV